MLALLGGVALAGRPGAGFHLFGLGGAVGVAEKEGVVFEGGGDVGMVVAQGLLADLERALVERLGVVEPALGAVEDRQVVEGLGDIGMVVAQGLLADLERTLVERLSLNVTAASPEVIGGRDSGGVTRRRALLPLRSSSGYSTLQ